MSEAPKLTYYKWFLDQAKVAMDMLTDEQLGELFRAVMSYVDTGKETAVSAAIQFPYRQNVLAVDRLREAYTDKVEKNRENGAKGGRAKAAKAKNDQQPGTKKYKPTKTEFKNAVKHLRESEETIDVDDHNALLFYEEMKKAGWEICGRPIKSLKQLESVISERFYSDPPYNQYFYWLTFQLFVEHGFDFGADAENHFEAENKNSEFWDLFQYDGDTPTNSGWTIDGEFYNFSKSKLSEAVEAFLATASER